MNVFSLVPGLTVVLIISCYLLLYVSNGAKLLVLPRCGFEGVR